MHLQEIRRDYKQEDVEVAFVVSGASDMTRRQDLPRFKQDFNVSYTVLDDGAGMLVALYKLNPGASVAKNLIIDREGTVRLVGEFTPLTEMAEELDSVLEKGKRTLNDAER